MTQHSEVIQHDGGTSFVGSDAVKLLGAIALKQALAMYARNKMRANRHLTPGRMLEMATDLTGHPYKRGQHHQAAEDVADWIETMKAAMPIRST